MTAPSEPTGPRALVTHPVADAGPLVLRPWPVKARVALIPFVLALSACSNTILQQGPSDALRAYSAALQDGRVDEAYRLLSDEAKRNMSLEAFRRAVKENPHDAGEIARAPGR